ncbi:hypothetical protein TVAG_283710 [Trichomonas vaginalis G3]|uniref:Guanylate cyclase domain-containing protein n=1 Tax=Trichomonas vaginalis (strain ATCC PRA-98 / G3) TaxID=412133 RepID=A2DES5_TRIV3|nr:guanylate cyclase protein [Trichomonas vaginalis G3]EAY21202.1 hypothetical protein TVAG_283710 [Trichomonas vaginalis G3]KAI5522268.1 guanylate cyclase protein [Trichomonas vaginalis G3]|eukprot:XP_001582188.1 hypothetical protein [Trichomonas vaginalis G3]
MPSSDDFWGSESASDIIIKIIAFPINLGIGPKDFTYHIIETFIYAVFYIFNFSIHMMVIWRNPKEKATTNKTIYYLCVSNILICPTVLVLASSNLGVLFRSIIFYERRDPILYACIIIGILTVSISATAHYYGVLMIRHSTFVDFKMLFRPWSPYLMNVLAFDYFFVLLCLLEGLFDMNKPIYILIFSILCLVICNPIVLWYFMANPVFQNTRDSVYILTVLSSGMYSVILMDIKYFAKRITPIIYLFVIIVIYIAHYFLYFTLTRANANRFLMKLYSVYKQSTGVLPPAPPLMVFGNNTAKVALTQEAYNVMQAFSSLEISTSREFQNIVTVGASMRMPAVTNFDFIRWGLNFFIDKNSLMICSQICNYYHENAQTQSIILQSLRSNPKLSNFDTIVVNLLDLEHTDVISDQPIFYRTLKVKAMNAQARCRRCISSFWSAVLNQSIPSMNEGLCKLRNSINDAQAHFDELLRCYPNSIDAISMYLSYLLENKFSFLECYKYINKTSSSMIESKIEGNKNVNQTRTDAITTLMKDTNSSYAEYLSNITTYAEQERRVKYKSRGPSRALMTLVVLSFIVIIACFIGIIWSTLKRQMSYPSLLEIITRGSDVIIDLASLSLAARHLCLYKSGAIPETDENITNNLAEYILNGSEALPNKILTFYTTTAQRKVMIDTLNTPFSEITLFNQTIHACLGRTIGVVTNSIRNLAVNFQEFYKNGTNSDSICRSEEMKTITSTIHTINYLTTRFINRFKQLAEEEIGEFDKTLKLIVYILPGTFLVFFLILLLVIRSYVIHESSFRMTLYLSLPEKIASNIIHKQNEIDKKLVYYHSSSSPFFSSGLQQKNNKNLTSASQGQTSQSTEKSKAMKVESLYQFTNSSKEASTTGIIGFTVSMIVFFIVGALSMFGLIFYAKHVNLGFIGRIFQLCDTTRRYSSLQYVSLLIVECFNYENEELRLFDHQQLVDWTKDILKNTSRLESDLTYGNDDIPYTYREYPMIASLFDGTNNDLQKFTNEVLRSHYSIRDKGYEYLGIESKMQLFLSATRGILNIFSKNLSVLNISTGDWLYYNRLIVDHIVIETANTTEIYIEGANSVISHSFLAALHMSVAAIILLMIIYIGPIVYYSRNLRKYFNLTTQILAGIPPEIFRNTFYINNWLQKIISRRNFSKYEATFKRSVSTQLQSNVSEFIPEKIFLFTTQGSFIDIKSYDLSEIQGDVDLAAILNIFFELKKQPNLLDNVQRSFANFLEAKDKMENVIFKGISRDNRPLRITLHGITTADSISLNLSEMPGFYAYVSMSILDITKETEDDKRYQAEANTTLSLLETVIPHSLARRIHSGEQSINFSAGIGCFVVLQLCEFLDYGRMFGEKEVMNLLNSMRQCLGGVLGKFSNITTMHIRNGRCYFIAGLFNEDQNGITEVEDCFGFFESIAIALHELMIKLNFTVKWKGALSTGGPIFCRLVVDVAPIAIADGDPVSIAEKLLEIAKPGQILFDKTTLECAEPLKMTPIELSVTDVKDRKVSYYYIPIDSYLVPQDLPNNV